MQSALDEGVHAIGLSVLSGSHEVLVIDVLDRLKKAGFRGSARRRGRDHSRRRRGARLRSAGVKRVYTPKDFDLTRIMSDIVERRCGVTSCQPDPIHLAKRLLQRDRDAVPLALNLTDDMFGRERERTHLRCSTCWSASCPFRERRTDRHVTGAPGAGKSTLLDAFVRVLRRPWRNRRHHGDRSRRARSVGGRCSGDRVRMRSGATDPGVFIRSMAARQRLGGLADPARAAVTILSAVFERVFVETVGVGQSEAEIATLVDTLIFVVNPGTGDALQFMKAGVIELPDLFIVNKADLGADRGTHRRPRSRVASVSPSGHRRRQHARCGSTGLRSRWNRGRCLCINGS